MEEGSEESNFCISSRRRPLLARKAAFFSVAAFLIDGSSRNWRAWSRTVSLEGCTSSSSDLASSAGDLGGAFSELEAFCHTGIEAAFFSLIMK